MEEIVQMISVSVIGMLIISGKPSGNDLLSKRWPTLFNVQFFNNI
jgi:hypothetical protein